MLTQQGIITKMVGLGRLELPTSPLSGVRSNQLSYKPMSRLICLNYFYSFLLYNKTICVNTTLRTRN
jgi:hypothetical protein